MHTAAIYKNLRMCICKKEKRGKKEEEEEKKTGTAMILISNFQ